MAFAQPPAAFFLALMVGACLSLLLMLPINALVDFFLFLTGQADN